MPKFQTDALADRDSESVLSDCFFLCLSMKYKTFLLVTPMTMEVKTQCFHHGLQ